MSWLFSQALVEASSEAISWDGEPLSQLNVMPTPHKFWRNDKTMEPSQLSRFGLTCAVLTEDRGAALLTWFLAGFPVKTSALQERAQESAAHDLACGPTWLGWLAKYDPASSGWRTAQQSFLEDSGECLETFPRSGMTRGGLLWELPTLERTISETDSGYWPTPNAMKASNDLNLRCSGDGRTKPNKLGWAVAESVWPTPVADDTAHRRSKYAQGGTALSTKAGGALNPNWVEWLMGWPIGWTDLKPLAMGKSHSVPPQPSESFQPTLIEEPTP